MHGFVRASPCQSAAGTQGPHHARRYPRAARYGSGRSPDWIKSKNRGAQNFDAIGRTADIDWPPASIASEAYDPQRKWGVQRSSQG
jgi:hypothetical protein